MIGKSTFFILLYFLVGFFGFAQKVQRVISLAPSITENIYLLNGEDKLVGCTSFCARAVSEGIEKVGSTIDINLEKILEKEPDLVLTMELTKPQDLAAMKKLGMEIIVLKSPKSFDEICKQTLQIANLIGENDNAIEVVNSAKREVEVLKSRMRSSGKRMKVFFQIGSNPIFTVLENTFMNDFISFCNGENIAKGMKRGTISREGVLVNNPDMIMIATMGGFGHEELKVWKSYKDISAVEKNMVFLIDSNTSCNPTPNNFVAALTEIYENINKRHVR